jgi:hypothetical protein
MGSICLNLVQAGGTFVCKLNFTPAHVHKTLALEAIGMACYLESVADTLNALEMYILIRVMGPNGGYLVTTADKGRMAAIDAIGMLPAPHPLPSSVNLAGLEAITADLETFIINLEEDEEKVLIYYAGLLDIQAQQGMYNDMQLHRATWLIPGRRFPRPCVPCTQMGLVCYMSYGRDGWLGEGCYSCRIRRQSCRNRFLIV